MNFKEKPQNWADTIWNQLAHVICEGGKQKEYKDLVNKIKNISSKLDESKNSPSTRKRKSSFRISPKQQLYSMGCQSVRHLQLTKRLSNLGELIRTGALKLQPQSVLKSPQHLSKDTTPKPTVSNSNMDLKEVVSISVNQFQRGN